ncbi:thiopurine S-methyltransferase [Hydrogenophilus islandicus]
MEHGFWHERWERGEIGFHLDEFNPRLTTYWPQLQVARDATVFVPLCGKSLDLLWLREQGHTVVGVELSPVAVSQFFAENDATPEVSTCGPFACYTTDGIRLLQGDYFALTPEIVWGWDGAPATATAIYDRAALVALPPEMRQQYAAKMRELARPGTKMLLVTLEYPQEERPGPPFSVSPAEVFDHFAAVAEISHWLDTDVLPDHPRWQERGVRFLREHVFALTWKE